MNVYVAGGTGLGGPAFEAGFWNNPFLHAFGLHYVPQYNYIGYPTLSLSRDLTGSVYAQVEEREEW